MLLAMMMMKGFPSCCWQSEKNQFEVPPHECRAAPMEDKNYKFHWLHGLQRVWKTWGRVMHFLLEESGREGTVEGVALKKENLHISLPSSSFWDARNLGNCSLQALPAFSAELGGGTRGERQMKWQGNLAERIKLAISAGAREEAKKMRERERETGLCPLLCKGFYTLLGVLGLALV